MRKLIQIVLLILLGLALGVGTTMMVLTKASEKYIAKAVEAREAAERSKLPEKPWDFWTIEMENLANDLRDERTKVKQREESLAQREARLAVEQQELEKTRKQIEALRATIDQRLIEVTEGEAANLKKLAQTYGALTAKSAVSIFREMEDSTLVKLLAIMKPEAVAPILEEMSKQSAASNDATLAKRAAMISEKLRLIKTAKNPAASS